MKYLNSENTLIAIEHSGGRVECIEIGDARFAELVAQQPLPFEAGGGAEGVAAWRSAMVVSRFQALAALMDAGLLADIDLALGDAGPLAQLAWAEAAEFRRTSPLIAALAVGLGLTDEQVDALFQAAALIEV